MAPSRTNKTGDEKERVPTDSSGTRTARAAQKTNRSPSDEDDPESTKRHKLIATPKMNHQNEHENNVVTQFLSDVKEMPFRSTKHRIKYCVEGLTKFETEDYPATKEFATQLEEFLDSFGYFPQVIRNSYRSWLEEYASVLLEESVLSELRLDEVYQLLLSLQKKAEEEGNEEEIARMERMRSKYSDDALKHKKLIAKRKVIWKMIEVLGRMQIDVFKTFNDLQSFSLFCDKTGGASTTTGSGATNNFVQENQVAGKDRCGGILILDDFKCERNDLISQQRRLRMQQQSEWTIQKFEALSTSNDLTEEEKNELRSIASFFENWLANANVSKKRGNELKLKMKEAPEFLLSEDGTTFLQFKAKNPGKEVVAKKENGKLVYGTAEKVSAGEDLAANEQKWNVSYTDQGNQLCNLQQLEALRENIPECPPMESEEGKGSHLAMMRLLNQISGAGKKPHSSDDERWGYSPSKKKTELDAKNPMGRKNRHVDIVMSNPGQIQMAMLDNAMRLTVEVKPLLRSSQGPTSIETECKNQIVGHLSKYIYEWFNHQSIGVSSYATGVVSTLAYVKVLQFHLIMKEADESGKGVPDLIFSESKYLPLIPKSTFETWMNNHGGRLEKQKEKLELLKNKIYTIDNDKGYDGDIPPGILALYELARRSRDSFFGPKYPDIYQIVPALERPGQAAIDSPLRVLGVLGHGAFGIVLGAKKGENKFAVKTCARSLDTHIQNEINVFNELGQNRDSGSLNEYLPILEEVLELNVVLGSLTKKVKSLVMSPCGIPLLAYLSSQASRLTRDELKTFLLNFLTTVRADVTEGLEHVHQRGYVHNDVSPKNMIVVLAQEEGQRDKTCLVDFGAASLTSHLSKYPIGTPEFMHKELLNRSSYRTSKRWECKLSHDWFGFDLSCAAILNLDHPGYPSWDMNEDDRNIDNVLLERRKNAIAILDSYASEQKEVEVLEILIKRISNGEQLN